MRAFLPYPAARSSYECQHRQLCSQGEFDQTARECWLFERSSARTAVAKRLNPASFVPDASHLRGNGAHDRCRRYAAGSHGGMCTAGDYEERSIPMADGL